MCTSSQQKIFRLLAMIENKLIWLCTRKDFNTKFQERAIAILQAYKIDWENLYQIIQEHKVAPIVFENLLTLTNKGIPIPQTIFNQHRLNLMLHLAYRSKLEADITRILEYFNRKSVDVLLAKGVALDLTVYRQVPQYVPGDIDLLLKNRFKDVSQQEDCADITFFQALNYYPEWERYQHHDLSINGLLPVDFDKVWRNAKLVKVGPHQLTAHIMCAEDMLLFACISACRKRYFRLKSVCDIAEIIQHYPALNWQQVFQDAKRYQCKHIVYTALLVTQLTVGCQLPETFAQELGVAWAWAKIIRRLVSFLAEEVSLSQLSSAMEIKAGKVNLALLLVLISYNRKQNWARLGYVLNTAVSKYRETNALLKRKLDLTAGSGS